MGEINDRFGITADVVFPCVAVQTNGNAGAFCGEGALRVVGLGLRDLGVWVDRSVMLANMWLCAVEGGYVAMSSSAARKARIGEVPQAEGFGNGLELRVYG